MAVMRVVGGELLAIRAEQLDLPPVPPVPTPPPA